MPGRRSAHRIFRSFHKSSCHKAVTKNTRIKPTRSNFNTLRQIYNDIPPQEVSSKIKYPDNPTAPLPLYSALSSLCRRSLLEASSDIGLPSSIVLLTAEDGL